VALDHDIAEASELDEGDIKLTSKFLVDEGITGAVADVHFETVSDPRQGCRSARRLVMVRFFHLLPISEIAGTLVAALAPVTVRRVVDQWLTPTETASLLQMAATIRRGADDLVWHEGKPPASVAVSDIGRRQP
jgi:hypothetical protein